MAGIRPTVLACIPDGDGQASATPASAIVGRVTSAAGGAMTAPMTVSVGAEKLLPNGDATVEPVATTVVTGSTGGAFTLAGPLTVPATRNPDGSVLLDVTVTGGGTSKVFNLSAFPPDAGDPGWRWSSTPDTDLTGGAAVPARSHLTNLTLDMAGATTTPAIASTTAASPTGGPVLATPAQLAQSQTRQHGRTRAEAAASGMNCNVHSWQSGVPAKYAKRWVPVQRITMRTRATQSFSWHTSRDTQMQVAYRGPDGKSWAGGFSYSSSRDTVTGFNAGFTTSDWRGFARTRWRLVRQQEWCASTTWPYGAVASGIYRWYPRNWDGSSLPLANRAVWHCKGGTGAITKCT